MKSIEERKALHGEEYARAFDARQSRRRLDVILKYVRLRGTDRMLDIGCGSGLLMEAMAGRIGSYVGIDFSPAFVAIARDKAARLGFATASIVESGIEEYCAAAGASFDAAFALDLSEHIYDSEWLTILRAVRTVLRAEGRLYLHTPSGEFFIEKMKARGVLLRQHAEHVAVRTMQENLQLLRVAGYEILQAVRVPHYNILRLVHPLAYLPGIGPWFGARLVIEARPTS